MRTPELPLQVDDLVLSQWDRAYDVPLVQQASRDPFIAQMCSIPIDCDVEAARGWIYGRTTERNYCSLVIFDAQLERRVGEVALHGQADEVTANLYYWLLPSARGRGLARRACRLLCDWALTQTPLAAVSAFASQRNIASVRVLQQLGFQRAGQIPDFAGYPDRRDTFGYCLFRPPG